MAIRNKDYNLYEFAKKVLDIDITPVHQDFIDRIEKLDAKYGAGNWKLCYGRRGNSVIVSVPSNLTAIPG